MPSGTLKLLKALDLARTQWYHFTAIVVAGMGFFTDAYDLFSITTVTKMLGRIYYFDPAHDAPGQLPANVEAAVVAVALCGTLTGQLYFGWLGDRMGRTKVYGMTLSLMIATSIASGLSFGKSAKGVMTSLCFFRFWLGFGIGGDYPLSATIMSEYANRKTRGAFIAAVFAMQGMGILAASTVAIIVSAAFNRHPAPSFETDPRGSAPPESDFVWRTILMLGAIPAALTLYWRMSMPETARYTALVARNMRQAAADMLRVLQVEIDADIVFEEDMNVTTSPDKPFGLFSRAFLRRHGLRLLGTTTSWFVLDIAFYSNNLFQKDIFTAIGWLPPAREMNAIEEVYEIARAQALIALGSTIPGYWFTVAFVEILGRKTIQFMGFFFMTVFMLAASIPYYDLRGDPCAERFCGGYRIVFVVLYSFIFFFSNFGPNSTTFIIPAEIFPARMRSTCHGISAAAGKAGAIVGSFGFLYASQSSRSSEVPPGYQTGIGLRWSLISMAIVNGTGILFTFLVPETKGKSLEELTGEAEDDENACL